MKLLYVVMTRPLHELVALYNKTLTKPINSYLGFDKSGSRLSKIIDNR